MLVTVWSLYICHWRMLSFEDFADTTLHSWVVQFLSKRSEQRPSRWVSRCLSFTAARHRAFIIYSCETKGSGQVRVSDTLTDTGTVVHRERPKNSSQENCDLLVVCVTQDARNTSGSKIQLCLVISCKLQRIDPSTPMSLRQSLNRARSTTC